MIGLLRGKLARHAEDHIILETHGVGYLVHCDQRTLAGMQAHGGEIELSIETQVREDSITLYGFVREDEKAWFKRLQGIQGVGARSALSLLSVLTPDQLATAVLAQDKQPLTKAQGVGPKLAGRIVAELKDRLPAPGNLSGSIPAEQMKTAGSADLMADAIAALVQLGFGRSEAFASVSRLEAQGYTKLDDLIRLGLKELSS